ncbi:MAG: alpha/beta hydrolase [Bryobacteraceae bacterium]|nr:alpha/beta hydrolase [Bryobacteraceae bacterium]
MALSRCMCLLMMLCATIASAQIKEEIGKVDGAHFRILMPAQWNGSLVLWCGGYTPVPIVFRAGERRSELAVALLGQGYALAESGYSSGGIAVDGAIEDSDSLRKYFRQKYPRTAAVYVLGESMGGLVALRLMEGFRDDYKAGLSFCGMLSKPSDYVRRAFDLLTLFAYFHPDTLPPPGEIPADFRPTEERMQRVVRALAANPTAAAVLRTESGAHDLSELGAIVVFHTDLLRDVKSKCGGNPVSNEGTLYVSSADPEQINAGVRRFPAAPRAANCLRGIGAARGELARPFLNVDASYDPVVPGWFANAYQHSLAGSPSEVWFVRQYVSEKGHCSVPLRARLGAFQELVRWSQNKADKPKPGFRLK